MDDLKAELARRKVTDVLDSPATLSVYASDASLYRVQPRLVARPRDVDEISAIVDAARATATPVTMRGAGTSIAGNAVGTGVIVDCARHLDRVLAFDPEAGLARVQPGVVHAGLQTHVRAHGWRFGPDPSTHSRCTVGGMIGNNACGSRALGYGRTVDNIEGMRVVLADSSVVDLNSGDPPAGSVAARWASLGASNLAHIRTHHGQFTRQVSGYSLEHLLPERLRLDRFVVGSEGTLALVTEATLRLVREPAAVAMAVLGFPTMADAGDAVPALLGHALIACEGLDARIVEPVRRAGGKIPDLPRGQGWLMVEVSGATVDSARAAAEALLPDAGALDARVVTDPTEMAALWRIREDGAGLAARSLSRPAHSGLEDAAVPPEKLGAWLRTFDRLLTEHKLEAAPYGHFGDGCVHARINFGFEDGGRSLRSFLEAAADELRELGGSVSGEHGDGRQRSALLARTYAPTSIALFEQVKRIADPDNLLNPGVLVAPEPVDEHLRAGLSLVGTGDALLDETHRCTGVGKCIARSHDGGLTSGVMCPSFAATRDETDATRGRSRVLQDALSGTLAGGIHSPAVTEALDLCLACKGCASDCPTGVDMAAYKSEVLYRRYAGTRRPRSHLLLGRLPNMLKYAEGLPAIVRKAATRGPAASVAKAIAGIHPERALPALAGRTLRRLSRHDVTPTNPDVWLWGDTFTNHFLPENAIATLCLLRAHGLSVGVIPERTCCALTMISTGQLDEARASLTHTVERLTQYARTAPILGLEPSCLATLRDDAPRLLATDMAHTLAHKTRTLAELLKELDYTPPDLTGVEVVAQPHCHHASILGWAADRELLEGAGAVVHQVGGCCGLAGNFGMEKDHYAVSRAVAETQLLPTIASHPGAVVLADGLSCHHQLDDLANVKALHLAQLLERAPK